MENFLSLLPYLACPVSMGLMMWLMMRGNKDQMMGSTQLSADRVMTGNPPGDRNRDDRLTRLRAQLKDVEAQQAAICATIARLAAKDQPVEPRAAARSAPHEPVSLSTGHRPEQHDGLGV